MINRFQAVWFIYVVRCRDNSLYCGITKNLKKRVKQHNDGTGAKYTRSRRPVKLVWVTHRTLKSDAMRLEHKFKSLTKAQKEATVTEEWIG